MGIRRSVEELSPQMHANWKSDPQVGACKYAAKPFPGKDWEMGIFAYTFCAEPWGMDSVSTCAH